MLSRELDALQRAKQFRECAARLREVAPFVTSGHISREYVEELAGDFERFADSLKAYATEGAPPAEILGRAPPIRGSADQ